ncbi:MAG: class I SAM-dependent rRNA methyltransferase [Chloroflexi bacterium]|nr:class I SAM-dependent rRNA methyltransferase [Chloroflexota bacterium]
MTAVLHLKPKREKPVRNRHPWIFSGAIARIEGDVLPGDLVTVVDSHGRFQATAYYNPHSQIQARILSWDEDEPIDDAFWQGKLERAIAGRKLLALEPETTAYRLVNAEADGLPGLIVDKYGDFLVMQCLTLGIDQRKELLIQLLADLLQPAGIVERSDAAVRKKEGLPKAAGVCWGERPSPSHVIQENNLQFGVDLLGGHKTGFYLDQRENRALLGQPRFVNGQEMLNVFAYTGAFGLYAIVGGAAQVTHIDSAIPVLEQAERNAALNNFTRPQDEYLAGDAFEILRDYRDTGQQFDVIVLDPPKFAHGRRDERRAARGYKDLNWLALRLLRPGGLLATFSCSGLIDADLFQKIVFGAAVDARRDVQILQKLGQAPDHPILLTFPESSYLKGMLCRVW